MIERKDVDMRLKHIDIRNFRGYEQKSFDFDRQLSVVVGNNTAGKTALLQAIQVALGAYLASLKVVNAQDIVDGKAKPDSLGVNQNLKRIVLILNF